MNLRIITALLIFHISFCYRYYNNYNNGYRYNNYGNNGYRYKNNNGYKYKNNNGYRYNNYKNNDYHYRYKNNNDYYTGGNDYDYDYDDGYYDDYDEVIYVYDDYEYVNNNNNYRSKQPSRAAKQQSKSNNVNTRKNYDVYVLNLEDGKKYVGYTGNFDERMDAHFEGKGAKWTKKHKPVSIDKVFTFTSEEEAKKYETELYYSEKEQHGKDNVRGAGHTSSK